MRTILSLAALAALTLTPAAISSASQPPVPETAVGCSDCGMPCSPSQCPAGCDVCE